MGNFLTKVTFTAHHSGVYYRSGCSLCSGNKTNICILPLTIMHCLFDIRKMCRQWSTMVGVWGRSPQKPEVLDHFIPLPL